jgi:hypothetical protein
VRLSLLNNLYNAVFQLGRAEESEVHTSDEEFIRETQSEFDILD